MYLILIKTKSLSDEIPFARIPLSVRFPLNAKLFHKLDEPYSPEYFLKVYNSCRYSKSGSQHDVMAK